MKGIKDPEFRLTYHRLTCAIDKSLRAPGKEMTFEERASGRPLKSTYSDLLRSMDHMAVGRVCSFVSMLEEYSWITMMPFIFQNDESADVLVNMIR